ncbi:NUDIX domain-containing protein [Segatella baroniae]|uniref:NUDIX domain-containing protein n=1 Tax=Segatella baroniae TaxID=305719 RepID=UPI0004704E30|nr:NUDIX domain-containing protein [Segatella baroniae]
MQHPLERFHHCPLCGSRRFVIHNEKSRHCDDCGLTYYANPSAATVALIVNDRGEMLVARRKKEPARGTLDLPGGFVDMEETAEEGVRREVKEETGLDVVASEFLFSLPNIYPYSGVDVHTLDLFFRCKVADANHATAMDDVAETFWLPIDRIDPDDFGLRSIRQGVIRLLEHREWAFT